MLKGKTIILGVSGGIAAYKAAEMVRILIKSGAKVHVIMTENATEFVAPLTFQTLSQNPVHIDSFNLIESSDIAHISLAERADALLICPATANILGKAANGIADDLLSTTIMSTKAPVIFAPSMNVNMWESPGVQRSLEIVKSFGYHILEPGIGELACKTIGKGRLADLEDIKFGLESILSPKPLKDKEIVITAGPTQEPMDPVRYISNHSSGKMGFALARAAKMLGAKVTLVAGPTTAEPFKHVDKLLTVQTGQEMFEATKESFQQANALIMCAAVADFTPCDCADEKVPKGDISDSISIKRNPDIIKELAADKGDKLVVGFAAQTQNLLECSKRKVSEKNMDFIIANNISHPGVGFGSDDNEVLILDAQGGKTPISKKPKTELAFDILSVVFALA